MKQCIKFDVVDIAKRIVGNRWHTISDEDVAFAQRINLRVNSYFEERSFALNYNNGNRVDEVMDIDTFDWNEEGGDSEFDENDDWQNAMDEDTAPLMDDVVASKDN